MINAPFFRHSGMILAGIHKVDALNMRFEYQSIFVSNVIAME